MNDQRLQALADQYITALEASQAEGKRNAG
jgi:hypothetical protein